MHGFTFIYGSTCDKFVLLRFQQLIGLPDFMSADSAQTRSFGTMPDLFHEASVVGLGMRLVGLKSGIMTELHHQT